MPMSATRSSPVERLPGATRCPSFAAWNVTVTSAQATAPSTSPVEPSTPEAMSAATTGAPHSFIASIASEAGERGAPSKPVPKIASTTQPEPSSAAATSPGSISRAGRAGGGGSRPRRPRARPPATGGASRPRSRSRPEAARRPSPSPPLLPLPQTIRTGPGLRDVAHRLGECRARGLHQLKRRNAALVDRLGVGGAHALGVVKRIQPVGKRHRPQRRG